MPVRLGRFEMPKRLQKEETSATSTYAKFSAEPFETGFGHTIGNSLRRLLLSSLEGAAITSVKIEGAQHEFAIVEGVVEDVTEIVLNLKKVKFISDTHDSIFSPVTRVKYAVEAARIGQRTDYDRIVIEIWTDGRITPDDALLQASAILQKHLDVFVNYDRNAIQFTEVEDKQDEDKNKLKKLLNMSVNEIELSVRAANCLNNANITTVGQLAMKTEGDMLKYRNFGKKSLQEIKDKLTALGLGLGMSFDAGLLEAPKEENAAITQ